MTEISWEARDLWKMFAQPDDGAGVMDGAGLVLRARGGRWYRTDRAKAAALEPLVVASALCPDLADEFKQLAEVAA